MEDWCAGVCRERTSCFGGVRSIADAGSLWAISTGVSDGVVARCGLAPVAIFSAFRRAVLGWLAAQCVGCCERTAGIAGGGFARKGRGDGSGNARGGAISIGSAGSARAIGLAALFYFPPHGRWRTFGYRPIFRQGIYTGCKRHHDYALQIGGQRTLLGGQAVRGRAGRKRGRAGVAPVV